VSVDAVRFAARQPIPNENRPRTVLNRLHRKPNVLQNMVTRLDGEATATMAYLLEEQFEDGTTVVLGEPMFDLVVARVIAARRASRTRRTTVVRDRATGTELARFDGNVFVPTKSGQQMRAFDPSAQEAPTATLTRRKIG
jgi:hypothetical protein